jgi:mannitol-1-/sugar-/sorbitol-6-phosphatase
VSQPGWQVSGDALLIDLDGTLVDSHASIAAGWGQWARRYGVDLAAVLAIMPGRNATSVMREMRPDLPESVLAREYATLLASEIADAGSVTAMPGAHELLDALPPDRWALVTACTRELAQARLRAAGLPVPAVLIGAEAVPLGKPDPAGYLAAAESLDTKPECSLVIEDAPAGVAAGLAAGMQVIAVPPAAVSPSGADYLTIPGLDHLDIDNGLYPITLRYHRAV